MAKINEIQNTYGSSVSVAIANTTLDNVLNANNLPVNSIIINSEYDSQAQTDIGHPSMVVTDYEGTPAIITRYIEEKNGLHSDNNNKNLLYMHIDSSIKTNDNGSISLDLNNIIDNTTLVLKNEKIDINAQKLEKTSTTKFGVMKVDNNTIVSDNGTLHVATNKLDYANNNIFGIAKGDNSTIVANNGVLSVNTENIQKASNIAYGVVKPDNLTIKSDNGTLYVDRNGVGTLANNGFGLNKADNDTILQTNGVLRINEDKLPKATNASVGVVKIDQNSLEIGQSGILQIKDYANTLSYIYDLQAGIDVVEQKIAYIRNFLDNNEYQNNIPTIRHLSCNETTTTMLAPPESMEEPINMPIQHVYVSLNVITNCDFSIDIDYENNETPTIELDNINYNDEYHLQGIEALEHTWESTGMEEKNIILLFNCKNFLSSTGPKTKITKLNIKVSAKENSNESKLITYSIIRYNSYFIEPEPEPEPEPEYDAEFIIDEANSRWIITCEGIDEQYIENHETNGIDYSNNDIVASAYLTDPDEESTIDMRIMDSSSNRKLFLIGAYINVKTKEIKYFYKEIDTSTFITSISGKYVYDFAYKVKFDTLYYKLRYYIIAPTILLNDGTGYKRTFTLYHQNYKDCPKEEMITLDANCTIAPFLKINNNVITGTITGTTYTFYCDNDENDFYAQIYSNNPPLIYVKSNLVKYNAKSATIYLVDNDQAQIPQSTLANKIDFESLFDCGNAAKIMLTVGNEKYETYSYMYVVKDSKPIKDEYEFLYGSDDAPQNIYMYATKKFDDVVEEYDANSTYQICYISEYYSLKDNNQDFKKPNSALSIYVPGQPVFRLKNPEYGNYDVDSVVDSYCFTVSYNIFKYDEIQIPYYSSYMTSSFILTPVSMPMIYATGISVDETSIDIANNYETELVSVYSINGKTSIGDLADSITISYYYTTASKSTDISFADDSCNYTELKVNAEALSSYSIKAVGIRSNGQEIVFDNPGTTLMSTNTFKVDEYKSYEMLLIYAYETANENNHSNVIGDFVFGCEMPNFDLIKASPVFVDGSNLYSYYEVSCSKYGRNSTSQLEIVIDNSYISQNTYYRHNITGTESYTEKYLYNSYTLNDSYTFAGTPDPIVQFNCTGFTATHTYCGYINSGNKTVFNIGITNSDLVNTSLSCKLSYIVDNQQHIYDLTLVKKSTSLLGVIEENTDFSEAEYIFLTASGYSLSGNTYYNPIVMNLTYSGDNKQFNVANDNISKFYDDSIKTLTYSINNVNETVINNANMKLEIYNGRQLAHTIVALDNNELFVNSQRTTATNNSNVGLLKLITTASQHTTRGISNSGNTNTSHSQQNIEVPITYIYNIPNLSNGFEEYCHCNIYKDYFVPRFSKPYDKYFTPYEYTITAHLEYNNNDILNKAIKFADEYTKTSSGIATENNTQKPRSIKVVFEVKYKDSIIFTKTISVNKETNFDGITYLMADYVTNGTQSQTTTGTKRTSNQTTNRGTSSQSSSTTYFAYAYYMYSTNNKYTYSDIYTYLDVDHYVQKLFTTKTSSSQQETEQVGRTASNDTSLNKGLRTIQLSETGTHNLMNTHETIVSNSIKYYLTKIENDKFAYVWEYNGYDEDLESDVFKLCSYGDNKLDILPILSKNYTMNKINIL